MSRVLAIMLTLASFPALSGEVVYSRAELELRLSSQSTTAQKTGPSLLDAIRMRARAPGGDPVTEFQLRRDVLALELPLDDAAADVLQEVAVRDPSIRVWHEDEGHARVAETVLDAGAAARWVLRESSKQANAENWYANSAPLEQENIDDATRRLATRLPEGELSSLRQRLEPLFADGAPVEAALATVSLRESNATLALKLVQLGEPDRMRRLLPTLHAAFPSHAQSLLGIAMERSALAPHATSLLGQHASEAWAWRGLNQALEEPESGAAAAATMARHADDAQLAALAQRLVEPAPTGARAGLALYLNGSPYARQLLADFRDGHRTTALAEEIDVWLRD